MRIKKSKFKVAFLKNSFKRAKIYEKTLDFTISLVIFRYDININRKDLKYSKVWIYILERKKNDK
jgi:hypothetical protein